MRRATSALKSRNSKNNLKKESSADEDTRLQRIRKIERDSNICRGLDEFCSEIGNTIQSQVQLCVKFWELMQSDVLESDWFQEDDGLLATHVWALRAGLLIAPAVHKHLLKVTKRVKDLRSKYSSFLNSEKFATWNNAWVQKEHYERKLREMRDELTTESLSRGSLSADQLERLQRNEEKTAQAQDLYDSFHAETKEFDAARGLLKESLRDAVRTITCGWLISTGATVCTAVHEAEAELCRSKRAEQMPDARTPTQRVPALGIGTGPSEDHAVVPAWTLPKSMEDVKLQRGGAAETAFDPKRPFKADWTCDSRARNSCDDAEHSTLRPGMFVSIHGLSRAVELNGLHGTLSQYDHAAERWTVLLADGGVKALRPENMRITQAHPEQMSPSNAGCNRETLASSSSAAIPLTCDPTAKHTTRASGEENLTLHHKAGIDAHAPPAGSSPSHLPPSSAGCMGTKVECKSDAATCREGCPAPRDGDVWAYADKQEYTFGFSGCSQPCDANARRATDVRQDMLDSSPTGADTDWPTTRTSRDFPMNRDDVRPCMSSAPMERAWTDLTDPLQIWPESHAAFASRSETRKETPMAGSWRSDALRNDAWPSPHDGAAAAAAWPSDTAWPVVGSAPGSATGATPHVSTWPR